MKLTANFSLSEFEYSATALAKGIDNTVPTYLLKNVTALAERLQKVRDLVKCPLTITSGYRCPELNRAIGGAVGSQHQTGLAADVTAKGMSASELFNAIVASGIGFDQLIIEKAKGKEWVHFSVQPAERYDRLSYDGATYSKEN